MITRGALERLSEAELQGWLLRRMRGEEADPPLLPYRFETPDDYVAVVHGQTDDLAFRSRLERSIVRALAQEAEATFALLRAVCDYHSSSARSSSSRISS